LGSGHFLLTTTGMDRVLQGPRRWRRRRSQLRWLLRSRSLTGLGLSEAQQQRIGHGTAEPGEPARRLSL